MTSQTRTRPERRIAVLTNFYPSPSHTFIRREILALEALGWQIERFSHRRCDPSTLSPEDREEAARTTVLISTRKTRIFGTLMLLLTTRPLALLSMLTTALKLARESDGRAMLHLAYAMLACILWRELRDRACSHVHVHFGTNPAAVAMLVQRLGGVTYSITFHGPHEFAIPNRLGLPMKVAGASFIAVVSRWAEEVFKSRYPTQQHKAVLVHCGLEPAWLNRAEPAPHVGSQLVCVARLDAQKNPHLLLDASEQLAKRGVDFRLRFVGDGELRAAMEERVSKSNLAHRITFDGWASPSLVEEALCTARALVLSSDDEGLPVAIMEAFALGRPVVATDVAAVHELVETGVTGWLVPRRDADALADAMASALRASPEELRRLGTEGLRRVQRHDVRLSAQAMSDALHGAVR